MRNLVSIMLLGYALMALPVVAQGQEIPAKEGDTITVKTRDKSARVPVVKRVPKPILVEIVKPDPPPDTSYGDFELTLFKPDPRPKVTAADFNALDEVPEFGLFRVRVTYANPPGVPSVPVKMLVGPPTVVQPFPFQAKPTSDPNVYMSHVIYLNVPNRDPVLSLRVDQFTADVDGVQRSIPVGPKSKLMTVVAKSGDQITADVEGIRDSATVVALPAKGIIADRGLLSRRKDPGAVPTEIDCSCKSVTLNRIVSRQYTHSTGLGILENKWHYKVSVRYQLGDNSNPPERGKVVIPWRKDRDVMEFYFTFPQGLAYIVPDGKRPLCRALVELEIPHQRRSSGNIKETTLLYMMRGMGMGTASRNMIGRATTRDTRKGPGRVRWAVGKSGYCSEGVPFIIR